MRQDTKKLKDLVVYILDNFNNSNLTETKLQKLLYYCDFDYYQRYYKPITGYTYFKNHYGPTIKNLPTILLELQEEGLIKINTTLNYFGSPQRNFKIVKHLKTVFSTQEKKAIDIVNSTYIGLTPREMSTLSHSDPPYVIAEDQGKIDYSDVIYRDDLGQADESSIDKEAQEYFQKSKLSSIL